MMLSFRRTLRARHFLFASFLAVTVPMLMGYALFRANPSACYDSPCELPLLLLTVPPFAAPVLTLLFAINRRRERPFPDGWLPTVLMSGLSGQIAISLASAALASPNIRRIFFSDILFIPQGFVVGMVIGGVFWIALHVLGQQDIRAPDGAPRR